MTFTNADVDPLATFGLVADRDLCTRFKLCPRRFGHLPAVVARDDPGADAPRPFQ